jgi:hypothetical protein
LGTLALADQQSSKPDRCLAATSSMGQTFGKPQVKAAVGLWPTGVAAYGG